MTRDEECVSVTALTDPRLTTAEQWLRIAQADYRLCREFAQRFDARLERSLRCQRVAWEAYGHVHSAVLLPDSAGHERLNDGEWYLYYVSGESLFRRSRSQREQSGMIVLADSMEDWAGLLRQALRRQVFDVRYEITPDYVNALGETELTASGFVFTLEAYAPQAVGTKALRITGAGVTPEQASREACRQWLQAQGDAVLA